MRKYVVVGYTVDYSPNMYSNKELLGIYTESTDALFLDLEGELPEILAVLDVEEKADADEARTVG